MNWTAIWTSLFGTTSLFGVNMGFWAGMASVLLIVILMNVVFWSIKPQNPGDSHCPESYLTSLLWGRKSRGEQKKRTDFRQSALFRESYKITAMKESGSAHSQP